MSSPSVTFPTVSAGCGALGGTVNGLLELPRSDIAISFDFALEKGSSGEPMLAKPKVRAAKSVKSGKPVTLTVRVPNTGDAAATSVKVRPKSPAELVKGKTRRCPTVAGIDPGKTARFVVDAAYSPTSCAAKKHTKTGHVTLL